MGDFGVSDADMQRDANRGALQHFWEALIAGRTRDAAQIYADDAVLRTPQGGEELVGGADIAARGLLAAGEKLVKINSILGDRGLWISECETLWNQEAMLLVSIAEMHSGKIIREIRYRMPGRIGSRGTVAS